MKKRNKKSPVCALCSTLGTALLIILILLCVPFTVPKLFGFQAYTVISGSMEPEIPVGSLVYIGSVEPEDVQKDDIIAFYGGRDNRAIITHRVVENRVIMGEFITKGDANATNDMNPISYEQLLGQVKYSVPKVGVLAQLLTGAEGKIAAGCLIALAIVLHLLASVLERGNDKKRGQS